MENKSKLGDFEVLSKLGQGSFGTVFKVKSKGNNYLVDNQFYVMKVINISQMDKRGQEEANREVRILRSLENPYIVKYYDSFIENRMLHIIMEFCDKGDLSHLIESSNRLLPEVRVWKYLIQMLLGLEYLHKNKILHRDIKSMNVFLAGQDSVRIGDLGVAKVLANTAGFAHTLVGTPYYLSPELCEEKPYNSKSDVWAVGCVLYEMCTLKHPFDARNQAALILKILKASYSPVSGAYSEELRLLVDMTLSKDHRRRPSVPNILRRPKVRERASALNIEIPPNSVLATSPPIPRNPEFRAESTPTKSRRQKLPSRPKPRPPKKQLVKAYLPGRSRPPSARKKDPKNENRKEQEPKKAEIAPAEKPASSTTFRVMFNVPLVHPKITLVNTKTKYQCCEKLVVPPLEEFSACSPVSHSKTPFELQRQSSLFKTAYQSTEVENLYPIAVSTPPEFSTYKVHYVKQNNSSPDESEDEAYFSEESQDSESPEEEPSDLEQKKLNFKNLIGFRRRDIISKMGEGLFNEFYGLFKSKLAEETEVTEEDQNSIDEFIESKMQVDNSMLIYDMYKLLHLESQLIKCRNQISALKK